MLCEPLAFTQSHQDLCNDAIQLSRMPTSLNLSKSMDLNLTLASLDPERANCRGNVCVSLHSPLTSPAQDLDDAMKNSALVPFALQTLKILLVLSSPYPQTDMCR